MRDQVASAGDGASGRLVTRPEGSSAPEMSRVAQHLIGHRRARDVEQPLSDFDHTSRISLAWPALMTREAAIWRSFVSRSADREKHRETPDSSWVSAA